MALGTIKLTSIPVLYNTKMMIDFEAEVYHNAASDIKVQCVTDFNLWFDTSIRGKVDFVVLEPKHYQMQADLIAELMPDIELAIRDHAIKIQFYDDKIRLDTSEHDI